MAKDEENKCIYHLQKIWVCIYVIIIDNINLIGVKIKSNNLCDILMYDNYKLQPCHELRGSLQDPIDHSLVSTEQHRSFGGGLCDLKARRKLELHSQVCVRRLQGLLEATNDL